MVNYLPTRKMVDEWVVKWERQYSKSEHTMSMPMYIRQQTSFWMACQLLGSGNISQECYEKLKKESGI